MRVSSIRRRWPPERVPSAWPSTRSSSPSAPAIWRRLGLGGIPARGGELGLEPAVAAHRLVLLLAGLAGHRVLGGAQVAHDRVEPAGREHPVAGGDVQVAGARVLGQVADLAGAGDRAGGGLGDPGEGLGQRGLARTVAPDQAHPVAGGDAEGRGVEEQAGARAQLDGGSGDHGGAFRWGGERARQGCARGHGDGLSASSLGAAARRAVHAPADGGPT